ncbi:MAG TPA: WD40 repeat domain-containing protein, partial [Cyanobacteria bacterium UBA9273]|nr:WD40 repeat domain-containing protein [Cyanobacteria bacterium UBA9273]
KVWDIATGFCIQTLMVDRLYECTFDQIRILT